ncbi:hypothetical protein ACFQV2_31360 [Actinokineospora soli]|uniref:Uncharacterized protein n=1 Tax=Actinokineospora soli TaxID=1048753 RepID=A0ABW2TV85_9PSEU
MDIVRPEVRAFDRADAEFRRRNGVPIPAHPTSWEPYWGLGRLDPPSGEVDAFAVEEASALLTASMSTRDPDQAARLFAQVPSARLRREHAASIPWWKRIFNSSDPQPPRVPIADLHPRAVPVWRDPATDTAVYDKPIQTLADLLALQPAALPGQTVSGGGAWGEAKDRIYAQFESLSAEYARKMQGQFAPQEALNIAIHARNAAVDARASKTLIAHWNEEIRQLLWIMRRMP